MTSKHDALKVLKNKLSQRYVQIRDKHTERVRLENENIAKNKEAVYAHLKKTGHKITIAKYDVRIGIEIEGVKFDMSLYNNGHQDAFKKLCKKLGKPIVPKVKYSQESEARSKLFKKYQEIENTILLLGVNEEVLKLMEKF